MPESIKSEKNENARKIHQKQDGYGWPPPPTDEMQKDVEHTRGQWKVEGRRPLQIDQTGSTEWKLSTWVDTKEKQGDEERYDRLLRKEMQIAERMEGVQGPDRLNYRGGNREGGSRCILYADDTTARVTGELWPEIEKNWREH